MLPTPNSRLCKARVDAHALAMPIAMPAAITRNPRPSTNHITDWRLAPSATLNPSSRLCCATANDTTP
jgi:hypothetical protein